MCIQMTVMQRSGNSHVDAPSTCTPRIAAMTKEILPAVWKNINMTRTATKRSGNWSAVWKNQRDITMIPPAMRRYSRAERKHIPIARPATAGMARGLGRQGRRILLLLRQSMRL